MEDMTYLIAARTGPEPLVCEVELLHAEGAHLLLIIVDELILLALRHGGDRGGETRGKDGGVGVNAHPGLAAPVWKPGLSDCGKDGKGG